MKLSDTATTNKLLLIIVIPLCFYILDILSFIFIPFMFAVFIALLFMPLMRWMEKKNVPKWIALGTVLLLIVGSIFLAIKLIQVSASEINAGKKELYEKLDTKVDLLITPFKSILGMEVDENENAIKQLLASQQVKDTIYGNFGITMGYLQATITKLLMTLFFLFLLLAGSINLNHVLRDITSRGKIQSVRTYLAIENSISKFLKVKFFVSLATGAGYGLTCYFLDISFPLFWGVFAFAINFVQMIGSVIAAVLASIMAFIEIDHSGLLLTAIMLFILVQVVFGSILEPILMGKSFSMNIIIVLIALMFWGFLWGIPGLILSIPMTVLMKTVMSQFRSTKRVAEVMS